MPAAKILLNELKCLTMSKRSQLFPKPDLSLLDGVSGACITTDVSLDLQLAILMMLRKLDGDYIRVDDTLSQFSALMPSLRRTSRR